jgi:hypothetical protein|tara:strand:+ start:493 stop:618 length:126 start_codon:yes stop_codon:yes gene_type:complete
MSSLTNKIRTYLGRNVEVLVDNGTSFYGGDRATYLTGFKIS